MGSGFFVAPGPGELAEIKRERLARKGREKQLSTLKQGPVLSIIDKTEDTPHNTQKEIAADLGWSTGKVAMGQKGGAT